MFRTLCFAAAFATATCAKPGENAIRRYVRKAWTKSEQGNSDPIGRTAQEKWEVSNSMSALPTGSAPELWPTLKDEEELQIKVREWKRDLNLADLSEKGVACFGPSCCGLGHRNKRTSLMALQAWAHGQKLRVEWMKCESSKKSLWDELVNSSYLYVHYNEWLSNPLYSYLETCERKASNEPNFSADFLEYGSSLELKHWKAGTMEEADLVRKSPWQWYFALQQIGLRHTQHGLQLQKYLSNEFWKPGLPVVAVHLRMGNGEVMAKKRRRVPKLDQETLFQYISRTAERAVREVTGKEHQTFRLFVATDQRSVVEAYQKVDPRVFFYEAGTAVPDGLAETMRVGVGREGVGGISQKECASLEKSTLIEATLMGYADILLTPQWSELTGLSKTIALARGAVWCQNRQWLRAWGRIPDPDTPEGAVNLEGSEGFAEELVEPSSLLELSAESRREELSSDSEAMAEWKSIMSSQAGYACFRGP